MIFYYYKNGQYMNLTYHNLTLGASPPNPLSNVVRIMKGPRFVHFTKH